MHRLGRIAEEREADLIKTLKGFVSGKGEVPSALRIEQVNFLQVRQSDVMQVETLSIMPQSLLSGKLDHDTVVVVAQCLAETCKIVTRHVRRTQVLVNVQVLAKGHQVRSAGKE